MKPLNLAVANLKLCGLHCKCKWMSNSMKVLLYSVPDYKSRSHWHWSHKLKVAYNFGRILSDPLQTLFVTSIHWLDPTPPPLLFDCAVFFCFVCVYLLWHADTLLFTSSYQSYLPQTIVELFTLQRCKYFVSCYLFIFILFFVSLYWWFALI